MPDGTSTLFEDITENIIDYELLYKISKEIDPKDPKGLKKLDCRNIWDAYFQTQEGQALLDAIKDLNSDYEFEMLHDKDPNLEEGDPRRFHLVVTYKGTRIDATPGLAADPHAQFCTIIEDQLPSARKACFGDLTSRAARAMEESAIRTFNKTRTGRPKPVKVTNLLARNIPTSA